MGVLFVMNTFLDSFSKFDMFIKIIFPSQFVLLINNKLSKFTRES